MYAFVCIVIYLSQSLQNFLTKHHLDDINDEYKVLKYLSSYNRRKLIKALVSFIAEEYNGNATQKDITTVCQAAISLYSCLKTEKSTIGGIVCCISDQFNHSFIHSFIIKFH